MLSIERTKELLNDPALSDEEIEKIRDDMRVLAEIIFEKWQADRKAAKTNNSEYCVGVTLPEKSDR